MRSFLKLLFRDERAQATTEYVILLAIVVGLILVLLKKILGPALAKIFGSIADRMDGFFSKGNLHQFRLGR